jgi:hypothetical protein
MSISGITRFAPRIARALATSKTRSYEPLLPVPVFPTVDACAQAQCEYCSRYGPLGSCQGCGAPNRPVQGPVTILTAPGTISDESASRLRRAWEASTSGPGQSGRVVVLESGIRMNVVPSFDQVKR